MMVSKCQYLTDEYREKLADLVADDSSISQQDVEERYIQKCKDMRRFLKDGTPVSVIRHISFDIIKSEF